MAQATYICSATRIRVGSPRHLLPFLRASARSAVAARRTPGNVRTRLLGLPPFPIFFTCTVWESPEAMAAFVKTPVHREAMVAMPRWSRRSSFVRFESSSRRPSWRTAFRALRDPDGVWTPQEQMRRATR